MKGDFFMTRRQMFRDLRNKNFTLGQIAFNINVSIITAKRWNKELKNKILVREHGLKNKKSNFKSKINREKIVNEYLKLAKEISKDGKAEPYNFKYYVKYKCKYNVSLSTFKNIMKENLVASPWSNRVTKKTYNKLLKQKAKEISSSKLLKKIEIIKELNSKVYFRKSRPEYEGEINEVDASKDYWLGDKQSHLYGSYDPATRTIKSLWLEKEETTVGYYHLLKPLLLKGEMPRMFKGDCRSSFVINKKDAGALAHKDVNTQFGFVLNQVGVKMENSSEPTFKGAIERFFRTAQNQLKGEFRERGITSFKDANTFLKEYIKQFNISYSIKPKKSEKKYINLNLNEQQIDGLLSIRAYRKTDKANSISFNNELYSLYDKNGNRVSFKEKSAILISKKLSKKISASYMGEELIMKKTEYEYLTGSQKEQYQNMRKLTPSFSAPDYHPWGYKVFMYYLQQTNNLKRYLSK